MVMILHEVVVPLQLHAPASMHAPQQAEAASGRADVTVHPLKASCCSINSICSFKQLPLDQNKVRCMTQFTLPYFI